MNSIKLLFNKLTGWPVLDPRDVDHIQTRDLHIEKPDNPKLGRISAAQYIARRQKDGFYAISLEVKNQDTDYKSWRAVETLRGDFSLSETVDIMKALDWKFIQFFENAPLWNASDVSKALGNKYQQTEYAGKPYGDLLSDIYKRSGKSAEEAIDLTPLPKTAHPTSQQMPPKL